MALPITSVIHVDQLFRKICSNKNIIDIIIIIVAVVSTYVDFERISDIETEIRVQRNIFPKKIEYWVYFSVLLPNEVSSVEVCYKI